MQVRFPATVLLVLLALVTQLPAGAETPKETEAVSLKARFVGRILAALLPSKYEKIPTFGTNDLDANYQLKIQLIEIQQGALPVQAGQSIGLLIHSPSQFFAFNLLGKVDPDKLPAEKPLLFELWLHPVTKDSAYVELRASDVPGPQSTPIQHQ
jgi:hypothetical protein